MGFRTDIEGRPFMPPVPVSRRRSPRPPSMETSWSAWRLTEPRIAPSPVARHASSMPHIAYLRFQMFQTDSQQ